MSTQILRLPYHSGFTELAFKELRRIASRQSYEMPWGSASELTFYDDVYIKDSSPLYDCKFDQLRTALTEFEATHIDCEFEYKAYDDYGSPSVKVAMVGYRLMTDAERIEYWSLKNHLEEQRIRVEAETKKKKIADARKLLKEAGEL